MKMAKNSFWLSQLQLCCTQIMNLDLYRIGYFSSSIEKSSFYMIIAFITVSNWLQKEVWVGNSSHMLKFRLRFLLSQKWKFVQRLNNWINWLKNWMKNLLFIPNQQTFFPDLWLNFLIYSRGCELTFRTALVWNSYIKCLDAKNMSIAELKLI